MNTTYTQQSTPMQATYGTQIGFQNHPNVIHSGPTPANYGGPSTAIPSQNVFTTTQTPIYQSASYQKTSCDSDLLHYTPVEQLRTRYGEDHPSVDPTHYVRDPSVLIAYLVPFPQPQLPGGVVPPPRFLMYTPPPPPLYKPLPGEKESKVKMVQRRWEGEVRTAKEAKGVSGKGAWRTAKSGAIRGINKAMNATKSSSIEFLTRVDSHPDSAGGPSVPLREIVLVHPPIPGMTEEMMKTEFLNDILRTKSKATRDAIIATSLLPVAEAIDIVSTVVWPFGGLMEIDAVWAISSFKGAKAARTVSKRLTASGGNLKLTFRSAESMRILANFMAAKCHERNSERFLFNYGVPPMDYEVIEAIGWSPSQSGGRTRNWEDDRWETNEVRADLNDVFKKSAREYDRWCNSYLKKVSKGQGQVLANTASPAIDNASPAVYNASPAVYSASPAVCSSPLLHDNLASNPPPLPAKPYSTMSAIAGSGMVPQSYTSK